MVGSNQKSIATWTTHFQCGYSWTYWGQIHAHGYVKAGLHMMCVYMVQRCQPPPPSPPQWSWVRQVPPPPPVVVVLWLGCGGLGLV